MIVEVEGDIVLTTADVIAHGVAPHDNFSSGLALALRERWPGMYKDFRHYCKVSSPKPGGLWSWGGSGGVRIVNLFTQEPPPMHTTNPGKASIKHVNNCLKGLHKLIVAEKFASVALPRLATGVGGLDWSEVRPLLLKHLGAIETTVYVYATYRSGVQAKE